VADRKGSITFGGSPGPTILRGTGNQNMIPRVIDENRHLVKTVHYVSDDEAVQGVRDLARRGIFVGGSSGVCLMGARRLASGSDVRSVLTFFADRGELYGSQFTGE
jgi:cysteine synthase